MKDYLMKTKVKFEVGDVVQLKSGGPPMTIGVIQGESIHCAWFHDGELRHDIFYRSVLTQQ